MKKLVLLASVIVMAPALSNAQTMPASMKHKLSVDGGLAMANGNTSSKNINFGAALTTNYDRFENTLTGKAKNLEQNHQRADEDYIVADKLKYDLGNNFYGFGEAEYFNDRFAGFDRRTHEIAGAGYYFRNDNEAKVSAETGVGARQTDYTGTLASANEFVAKAGGNVNWKMNENVIFNQDAAYYWGDDNQTTRAETSVKSYMNKDLYLKAAYQIENNSTVPVGKKDNEQLTTLSVGYELGN